MCTGNAYRKIKDKDSRTVFHVHFDEQSQNDITGQVL